METVRGHLRAIVGAAKGDRVEVIRGAYLTLLSRYPTAAEVEAAEAYAGTAGLSLGEAAVDLGWALVKSAEFLYRH